MKKFFLLFLSIFTALQLSAQKHNIADYDEVALGHQADGSKLMFHFIPADGEGQSSFGMRELPFLLVSDKGGYKLFNTDTGKEEAQLKLGGKSLAQVNRDGYLTLTQGGLFSFTQGRPAFYNFKGKKVWSCKDELLMADRRNNIVVCGSGRQGDTFVGRDMSTGKELWRVTIPCERHFPWGDTHRDQVDTRAYWLMADSLIRLDIVSGDTLRHAFTAGVKEPARSRFSIVRGRKLASRDFIREAQFSGVRAGILTGTHSNFLFENDRVYVADAENLYCFGHNLKEIWKTPLPEGLGAKSALASDGSQLRLICFGEAFQNGYIGRYGKSFAATYDKRTGRQLSLLVPDIKKKVVGGVYLDSRAYWQTDNGFSYTDDGDDTVHKIDYSPVAQHQPDAAQADFVICDTMGVVQAGSLRPIVTDKSQLVVEVYGKDVNVIHADGSVTLLPADSVYFHDGGNVYSTNNGSDGTNSFVIIDPVTRRVENSLRLRGVVSQDRRGNIFAFTKQGVGVRLREEGGKE